LLNIKKVSKIRLFNRKEKTMTWTILVLVIGIALYLFGGKLLKHDSKKPLTTGAIIAKESLKIAAIILIAGSVARLWTPYYLTSVNPGIVMEMAQAAQGQKSEVSNKEVRKYVRGHLAEMVENAPVLGNVEAKKTIFLWSDYSCPYCRRVHAELSRVLADRDDVRVVVKEFSIHGPLSDAPAKAVIAAKIQSVAASAALDKALMDKEYYTQDDMKDQSKLGAKVQANVLKLAGQIGLDVKKLEADMQGEVVAKELAQVRDLANKFQIGGTPFLIIGDQAFPGAIPYEQIIQALK
jgi:protein-disulfide isomerase